MSAFGVAMALAMQAAAAAPPPAQSLQARFDAASAAASNRQCKEAVASFESLERLPAVTGNAKVAATIKLRKGNCLLSLDRIEDAETALRAGIEALAADPDLQLDIGSAHAALGRLAYLRYDYSGAKQEFEAAKAILGPANSLDVLIWLTRVTMFDEGSEALSYADQALAQALAVPNVPKQSIASLRTMHARALLNHGQADRAYAELKKALQEQGGLGLKVDIGDVVTRSDLAIAAWLAKDPEAARNYLAYTGAGRWEKAPFSTAASMDPPPCGGPAGLRRDDVAIVEFGLRDDGSIDYAAPIYASRNGPIAVEFARAVADWSWRPEDMKGVPPLFRAVTRVELRCSTAIEKPSLMQPLLSDVSAWLDSQHAAPFPLPDRSDAQAIAPLKAELARRRAAGADVRLLPLLIQLGGNPVVPAEEKQAYWEEALKLAEAAHAPPAVITYVSVQGSDIRMPNRTAYGHARQYGQRLRGLLAQPEFAQDPHAGATLRILLAEREYGSDPANGIPLLQTVVDDSRLGPGDLFRQGALVRLASLQARAGDLQAARISYEQTGLSAQQCSLVDAKPAMRSSGASDNDFPTEALRYGFEGWVMTEFDIAADGKTAGQRAVIAYPPFVFRDAAVSIARGVRYRQSYRPEGGPGCGGAQESIHFRIPG